MKPSSGTDGLFAVGDRRLLDEPAVAVVGTRTPSAEGLAHTRSITGALAEAGFVVISGLARGVDAAAHRAAIAAGGRTIAVIGTPLERAYPAEHAELQAAIARHHLLVSPFARGAPVLRGNFPRRDRVLAALAIAVVVIEAADGSGTLHCVREAARIGRPLLLAPPVLDARPAWAERLLEGGPSRDTRSLFPATPGALSPAPAVHAVRARDDAVNVVKRIAAAERKGLLPGQTSH